MTRIVVSAGTTRTTTKMVLMIRRVVKLVATETANEVPAMADTSKINNSVVTLSFRVLELPVYIIERDLLELLINRT